MKKIYFFLVVVLLLISSPVFATPIPELTEQVDPILFPPIEPEFPPQPEQVVGHPSPPVGTGLPSITPELPQALTYEHALKAVEFMSGVAHYSHLRDWGFMPDTSQSIPLTQPFLGSEGLAATSTLTRTDNMTSDSYQDIEPSVIAYNSNGTVYRTTAYVKILADGITPRNYYSTTADYTTFYKGALALPSGYTRSADPLMAKNAYNGGIAPGRIYLSGIVYNPISCIICIWHA